MNRRTLLLKLLGVGRIRPTPTAVAPTPPVDTNYRITEVSDRRVTEAGDPRVMES